MKHIRISVFATLVVCMAATIAQATEQPNEIRCKGSGTTCTSGSIPVFATSGGSATVSNSIMSTNGATINVAGSENVTGAITSGQGINSTVGPQIAVIGSTSTGGAGVYGANASGSASFGVEGQAFGSNGIGAGGSSNIFGKISQSILGTAPIGVIADSANGYALVGASDNSNALLVANGSSNDTAVISNGGGGPPLYAVSSAGGSLFLDGFGNLSVSGAITAGTKDFKIDHPLDPANKYLYHASVESSEMMNIYTGTTLMDLSGSAVVSLPDWFEAVNGDFRYQLTAIGAPAPNLHVAREISNCQFMIAGGQPGMKVSWQVTGVRHDAYAKAHPLRVSVQKPKGERGYYLHPELYGVPMEKGLSAAHLAQIVQHAKRD